MGLGLLSGRGGPTFFCFLRGWGACARDRAEGGCVACLACGLWAAPAWAPGARVIGRGMVYAYLAGRGPTKTRCGWLCVPGWSHPRVWG